MKYWRRVTKFDTAAVALADRHYSRRKPGSSQFMPPGQTVVLATEDGLAVWGWWRPHPTSGLAAMNGLDGWTCTIFRNEGPVLSSLLVLDAESALDEMDIGPDGLLTYVWDAKVRSANPGACFKRAGWRRIGRSADGRKTLLRKFTGRERPRATPPQPPLDASLGQGLPSATMTDVPTQIAAIQQRQADARARVIIAGHTCDRAVSERSAFEPAMIIEAALLELARTWREEATWWEASGKRGGKGTAKELVACAARLSGFAVGLAASVSIGNADWISVEPHAHSGPDCCDEPCSHPDDAISTRKDGSVFCTACQTVVVASAASAADPVLPVTVDDVFPLVEAPHHDGDAVQPQSPAVPLFVSPTTIAEALSGVAVPVGNPFASPPPPGRAPKPVTRLSFADMPKLIADTYPVRRSRLSYSYVEDMEGCGFKALLGDASRHGVIGPRRPGWALVGGTAFHDVVEQIETAARALGGAPPGDDEIGDVAKVWIGALDAAVDARVLELAGGPYADPSTWHVANRGLENYDWWRVHGVDMVKLYLKVHDLAWRASHTQLQVPVATLGPDGQVVGHTLTPVMEFAYEVMAGHTSIPDSGRIDAAWMAHPPADGTPGQYPQATLEVVDFKSGARDPGPEKRFQLLNYATVLRTRFLPPNFALPIVGRFYLARKGIYTPPIALPAEGRAEVEYRFAAADKAMLTGTFLPSPSSFCSGCGVVDYCPTQSHRDA